MNIAVVGGGKRCRILMDSIEKHTFREISPKVVAVADLKDDAPGLVKAREKGVDIMANTVEQMKNKAISEAEITTLNHAKEIISEAEQRAKQIIEEAERKALHLGENEVKSKRIESRCTRFLKTFKIR